MCASPYDYCGPMAGGGTAGMMGFMDRRGSILAGPPADRVIEEPLEPTAPTSPSDAMEAEPAATPGPGEIPEESSTVPQRDGRRPRPRIYW